MSGSIVRGVVGGSIVHGVVGGSASGDPRRGGTIIVDGAGECVADAAGIAGVDDSGDPLDGAGECAGDTIVEGSGESVAGAAGDPWGVPPRPKACPSSPTPGCPGCAATSSS